VRKASCYNQGLGIAYFYHKNKIEFYENFLGVRGELMEEIHPETVKSYNNIGMVYKKMGDYKKSIVLVKYPSRLEKNY